MARRHVRVDGEHAPHDDVRPWRQVALQHDANLRRFTPGRLHARVGAGFLVVAGVETAGREAAEIRIVLKRDLPPGPYVVMWRVLSVDAHVTTGHYIFTYAPAAQ